MEEDFPFTKQSARNRQRSNLIGLVQMELLPFPALHVVFNVGEFQ